MKTRMPYRIKYRADRDFYTVALNYPECGLSAAECDAWGVRRAFSTFPEELKEYRQPRSRRAAERGAQALIAFLQKKPGALAIRNDDSPTMGEWVRLFLDLETSPRAVRLVGKNRPYSPQTIYNYQSIYDAHLTNDPILSRKMESIEQADILLLLGRIAAHRITIGQPRKPRKDRKTGKVIESPALPTRPMGGTRAFEAVYSFLRMTSKEYQKEHPRWIDPFASIDRPKPTKTEPRQGLEEEEVARLFSTEGVFDKEPELERAICAAMFWAGLRRSEIFGLMPSDLDWATPQIIVRHAWKSFDRKNRELGDPKHHKIRESLFPDILQASITLLWKKNDEIFKQNGQKAIGEEGQRRFVFCRADGSQPGPTWYKQHVSKWFKRAGIEIAGRKITPHSARHSLASILEDQGVSIRVIGELLGHSDLKTTKGYLHTPQGKINEITDKINKQ